MKISLNEALKVAIPYNHSSGDRVTISGKWLRDKAKLDAETKRDLHKLIRGWQGGGGKLPIFEPKRRVRYDGDKVMMYVIELKHREPPIHIVVFLSHSNPVYKTTFNKPNPVGKLFIFDRIIVGYDEYLKYINDVLKSA